MKGIDLRSDTVTQPTAAMRAAMAAADVGDDVFGEDPTVNRLEEAAAAAMGKEAALYVPSGTMGNLVALLAHCGRGDEVILGDASHTYIYEAGGSAAVGGIHPHPVATLPDGRLDLNAVEDAIRPANVHFPTTRLVCLENTHNRAGGAVLDLAYMAAVADIASSHGLAVHLDGARIFNAAAALDVPAKRLCETVDSVTFCLSKGLAAPVGSVLCGSTDFIARSRRARKVVGGGMRQAGILAAAGLVALETMVDRLVEDHHHAKRLAAGLDLLAGVRLDAATVQTNIVVFELAPEALAPSDFVARAAAADVHLFAIGGRRLRAVTHYEVTSRHVDLAVAAFAEVLDRGGMQGTD